MRYKNDVVERRDCRDNLGACPPEGSGVHEWTISAVAKCRADGLSLDETLRWVKARTDRSKGIEREITNLYNSSNIPVGGSSDFKSPPTEAKAIRFNNRPQPAFVAKKNEDGDVEDMMRFITHVFKPDETIYLSGGMSHDKFQGKGWQVWDVNDLLANHPDAEGMMGNHNDGLYVKVNPIKHDWRATTAKEHRSAPKAQFKLPDGSIATDVADFRHCLVEFDTGALKDQIAVIERAGLPVKAMCQSGDKSIHAIIAIDAGDDFALYKHRTELVVKAVNCAAVDLGFGEVKIDKVQDAVRWTRFAGALRKQGKNGKKIGKDGLGAIQKLLALFDAEWVEPEEVDEYADALMKCADAHEDVFVNDINTPKPIIDGFIRPGDMASLTAPSKVGKTWELIRMAAAVASGGEWMNMKCHPHNVMYLNFELHHYDMRWRVRKLLGDNTHAQKRLVVFNLRGMKGDGEMILSKFAELAEKGRINAKLLIIDPIYRFYGTADENSNTDISNLLMSIQNFASKTGMAVVFAHHHAKGKSRADTMTSGEQQAGAGAFTRTYDANINLGRVPSSLKETLNPDEHMVVEFDLRAFPRKQPMIVRWNDEDCEFEVVDTADVEITKELIKEERKQERDEKARELQHSRKEKILGFIDEHNSASVGDIMSMLELSRTYVCGILDAMECEGTIISKRISHGKKIWMSA